MLQLLPRWFSYQNRLIGCFMQIFSFASFFAVRHWKRSECLSNRFRNLRHIVCETIFRSLSFELKRQNKKIMVEWIPRKFNRQQMYLFLFGSAIAAEIVPAYRKSFVQKQINDFFFARTRIWMAPRLDYFFSIGSFFASFSTNNGLSSSFTDCFHAKSIE